MSHRLSKRLERLEAKARKRQPTVLNILQDTKQAIKRYMELNYGDLREHGLSEVDQAELDRLKKLLEPVLKQAIKRYRELICEHELSEAGRAELDHLKKLLEPVCKPSDRRLELTVRKLGGTLTPEEAQELAELERRPPDPLLD